MTKDELLAEIDTFLARDDVKITESTFGRQAVNDGKFVGRLRDGGGLTLDTAEKARKFIRDYPGQNAVVPSPKRAGAAA